MNFFKTALLSKVGIYGNGDVFSLDGAFLKAKDKLSSKEKVVCLILKRPYYSIEHHDYPVENKSSLKKIVSLEHSDPSVIGFLIGNYDGESRKVTVFRLLNEGVNALEGTNAKILLPDLILLKTQASEIVEEYQCDGHSFFNYFKGDVVYSIKKSNIVRNAAVFANSIGIASVDTSAPQIVQLETIPLSTELVTQLTKSGQLSNFITKSEKNGEFPWLKVTQFFASGVILHFLAVMVFSQYLTWSTQSLRNKNGELQPQVNELLELRNETRNLAERLNAMTGNSDQIELSPNVWRVYHLLNQQDGVLVQQIMSRISDSKTLITISGRANKASDLLQSLINFELIESARFTSDVVSMQDVESFRIEV